MAALGGHFHARFIFDGPGYRNYASAGLPGARLEIEERAMIRTTLFGLAVAAGLVSTAGAGKAGPDGRAIPQPPVRLAQNGDVEVYYDGRGRRVIVDPYTGEILAVQPARPMREYEPPRRERYYDDDPEDMARLRRDQQRDLQLREPAPEPAYPDDGYGYGEDAFPPAPQLPDEPMTAERQPVERAPLAPEGLAPDQPSDVIVQPDRPASIEQPAGPGARKEVAELQVLLDRKGASPGVIDGHFGSNVDKGLAAYQSITGQVLRSTDTVGITEALAESGGDAFRQLYHHSRGCGRAVRGGCSGDYKREGQARPDGYTSVSEIGRALPHG